MSQYRMVRVQHLIQEMLGTMIVSGVIKDPRVNSFLSITDVQVSRDIAYAKIYVSSFENEKKVKDAVEALNHAAGFIQSKLGKKLNMRNTPKLTFFQDDSVRLGVNMVNKLGKLN